MAILCSTFIAVDFIFMVLPLKTKHRKTFININLNMYSSYDGPSKSHWTRANPLHGMNAIDLIVKQRTLHDIQVHYIVALIFVMYYVWESL